MISLTNRHSIDRPSETCLFDTGLKSKHTRENKKSVKNCFRIFLHHFFLQLQLLLTTSYSSTQKFFHNVAFGSDNLFYTRRDERRNYVRTHSAVVHLSVLEIISTMPMLSHHWERLLIENCPKNYTYFFVYHHYQHTVSLNNSRIFFHTNMGKKNAVHRKNNRKNSACTYTRLDLSLCVYRIKPNRKIKFLFTPEQHLSTYQPSEV